ncbi:MAG: hypothetical protein L6R38_008034, partial [Xanthoria sp. 2 TBL-2021]
MIGKKEKGNHHPPPNFANLDGAAAPLPVRPDNRTEQKATRQEPNNAPSQCSHHSLREERYDLPDEYQNLDEVKEPSPIESSDVPRPQGYLEDHGLDTAQSDRRRSHQHHEPIPQQEEVPSPSLSNLDTAKRTPSALRQRVSRLATELYTISYLIFCSILGTLARLGLQALTFYPGAPVATGVLWANVVGCFIMGFLAEDRKLFGSKDGARTPSTAPIQLSQPQRDQEQTPSLEASKQSQSSGKKTIPLYIGLSTGFCGSLTSFSSFIRDAFLALANALPIPISHTSISSSTISPTSNIVHRNGGYSFMALLAVIITTVALSISALIVGAQLAVAVERYTPSITSHFARKFVDRATVILAWGSWLGAIFMAIWPPDRPATHSPPNSEHWRGAAIFAIVFAPLGCLSRFYISIMLNSKINSFPLGTFVVNMLGTALEGMFWDLQHSSGSSVGGRGVMGCQVLQGMMDGFCGAATTVSTWV